MAVPFFVRCVESFSCHHRRVILSVAELSGSSRKREVSRAESRRWCGVCGTASALPEFWVRYPIPAPDSILGPTTQNAHERLFTYGCRKVAGAGTARRRKMLTKVTLPM